MAIRFQRGLGLVCDRDEKCPRCKRPLYGKRYEGFKCYDSSCGWFFFAVCVDCCASLGKFTGMRCASCAAKRKLELSREYRRDHHRKLENQRYAREQIKKDEAYAEAKRRFIQILDQVLDS